MLFFSGVPSTFLFQTFLPSGIPAGSIGIVMRKGEEKRLAAFTAELRRVLEENGEQL